MTEEHLFQMHLVLNTKINIHEIDTNVVVNILSTGVNTEELELKPELIKHINTELNAIRDDEEFINILYALCISKNIEETELISIAETFYSFMNHMDKNTFSNKNKINSPSFAIKFYYLLCLFSLSKSNISTELLKNMWEYCTKLFNNLNISYDNIKPTWIKKIGKVNIDEKKLLLILSAIVDGTIFRGLQDDYMIFKNFHNLILIYLSNNILEIESKNLDEILADLKKESLFYEWIIDRDAVGFLPIKKEWFDSNIINNNTVILKKNNEILFRKPIDSFISKESIMKIHDGYGESITNYDSNSLLSTQTYLSKQTLKEFLTILINSTEELSRSGSYPNIFSSDKLIEENSLIPFTTELYNAQHFIFEDCFGNISSIENNLKNFITCIFKSFNDNKNDSLIPIIHDKYIQELNHEQIDIIQFLKRLLLQIDECNDVESDFYLDLCIASAILQSINTDDDLKLIDSFVQQYHKINTTHDEQKIYCVNNELNINDSNPKELFNTIRQSLNLTTNEAMPSLLFNLNDNINNYEENINNLLSKELSINNVVKIEHFTKNLIQVFHSTLTVSIGAATFDFSNVKVINVSTNTIIELSQSNIFTVNSSEHTYHYINKGTLYIIPIISAISKIFNSISKKFSQLTNIQRCSYPINNYQNNNINLIKNFDAAVDVISIHRNMNKMDSEKLLKDWLASFPKKYREMFTILISSHEVMHHQEIDKFCLDVINLIKEGKNAILIKKPEDYNGTYRCLNKNDNLSRLLDNLNPNNLEIDESEIIIICDIALTGSQIVKSLKYYCHDGNNLDDHNYYPVKDKNGTFISKKITNIKTIKINSILYTSRSLAKIKNECVKFMPNLEYVEVISGRNIDSNAFFESTTKIGNNDKEKIISILENIDECKTIYSYLSHPANNGRQFKKYIKLDKHGINSKNLVARYNSLPKLCFEFLYFGLQKKPSMHPMQRILESNDHKFNK